ncbi:MAG TPA: hypothetical protein ENJ86_11820 [Methylothermaceae bacterium]|nr:hypothetical protein [Methylothermaceae bacterium]
MATPQNKPAPKPQKKSPSAAKADVKAAKLSKGEEIGEAAGKVWQCLNKLGDVSPSKLASETGLSTKEVQRAIGWLAREGKLIIESDGRTEVFRLS